MAAHIDRLRLAMHLVELAERYGTETPESILTAYRAEVVNFGMGSPLVVHSMENALDGSHQKILMAVDQLMDQVRWVLCQYRDAAPCVTGRNVRRVGW